MASPDAADYTYVAPVYDPQRGIDACRRLAAAFAGGRDPRAEDIQAAMAAATAAFPGLQDFVTDLADRDLDPEDAMLDVSRIGAEHQGTVLAAAAKLALVGAMAAAAERFDWHDVVDCARFCADALSSSALGAP
ncbi:conserved protein of unknown function [Rhodovastum atsumiense]|uniref:Uncharacterized protein n=1 Tax=Rhodovastum atsumiense TaxID=504468 RepID=A0A5M6IWT0_9PROT|nr:hypothetical protein [Rhodovastum atsumiense]KAA5612786.1 hypothetical protein F1189_08605 [Rhodovastum atsumiense]CAH2602637.1 conserved protein of unknown function [Rhodovastum atsumiense]